MSAWAATPLLPQAIAATCVPCPNTSAPGIPAVSFVSFCKASSIWLLSYSVPVVWSHIFKMRVLPSALRNSMLSAQIPVSITATIVPFPKSPNGLFIPCCTALIQDAALPACNSKYSCLGFSRYSMTVSCETASTSVSGTISTAYWFNSSRIRICG